MKRTAMILVLAAMVAMATPSLAQASSPPPVTKRSYGLYKLIKCGLSLATFAVGNAVAIQKLRKLGGVWKVAKRLIRAKSSEARLKLLATILGEVTGIETVVEACA